MLVVCGEEWIVMMIMTYNISIAVILSRIPDQLNEQYVGDLRGSLPRLVNVW